MFSIIQTNFHIRLQLSGVCFSNMTAPHVIVLNDFRFDTVVFVVQALSCLFKEYVTNKFSYLLRYGRGKFGWRIQLRFVVFSQ